MQIKKRIIKKLWQGRLISLRDYEIQEAINKNYTIQAIHKNQSMMLTPTKLKDLDLTVGKLHKSMYDTKPYRLIDVRWNPSDRSNQS